MPLHGGQSFSPTGLKDILHEKWQCLSQCMQAAGRATICSLGRGMQKERNRRHLVFTYGTLKQGEPNHYHFVNPENGYARFVGTAKTSIPWPLIITTKWNLPFLVWAANRGKVVHGEVFEIDDEMLSFADDFEGHPEVYERDKMKVIINQPANESTSQPATSSESRSKHKGAADGGPEASRQACGRAKVKEELAEGECVYAGDTLEVWAYFLKHVSPAMLELPCIEEYSSSGPNFKEYDADEDLQGIEDIMKALAEVNL